MSEPKDFEQTLRRIRHMLGEGQEEMVLEQLNALQTDDPQQQQEITYARAEYFTRKEQWEKAVQYLEPLYNTRANEVNWNNADHTGRERRPYYRLWLAKPAVNGSR